MSLEALEDRIAPAALTISPDGRTVTWTDVDGDAVTLKITKGALAETNFTHTDAGAGLAVELIDLTNTQFAGTSLSITAKQAPGTGNASVDIGYVKATGNFLKSVTVSGDLGRLDAGPADLTTGGTQALGTLKVGSMGTRTDLLGATLPESEVHGSIGTATITGALRGSIHVTGDAAGSIGTLTVGTIIGSDVANTGRVTTTGNLGTLTIRGDLQGGSGEHSGSVEVGGSITKALISGSIAGGRSATPSTDGTGLLSVDGDIRSLTINGSIFGGSQQGSGLVISGGTIAKLALKGGIYGGSAGEENGGIEADALGKVTIGGNIRGGTAVRSGFITANSVTSLTAQDVIGVGDTSGYIDITGSVSSLQIASVIGGEASHSGWLSLGKAGKVTLSGEIVGGDLAANATAGTDVSGALLASHIGTLQIAGAVRAGVDSSATFDLRDNATIRVANDIVKLTVSGGLLGNEETRVLVTARGEALPSLNSIRDLAIQQASFGSVSYADIFAGYNQNSDVSTAAINPNAQIGLVKVTNSWTASNLVAGAAYSTSFGTGADAIIAGTDNPNIISRIGAIVIGGSIQGTTAAGDHYGFVTQGIGAFLYGPGALAEYNSLPKLLTGADSNVAIDTVRTAYRAGHVLLNLGTANDNDPVNLRYSLADTGDVRIFEFPR